MSNLSYWSEFSPQSYPSFKAADKYDVAVIGAGITGLTAAYLLKQSGKRVCVLEKNQIGTGESSRTSAHLTYVTDQRLSELAHHFGRDHARQTWDAGKAAIDFIEKTVRELNIDCGFKRVPGFLYSARNASEDVSALRDEQDFISSLGFESEFLESGPINHRAAIRFPNQAVFHPLRYLAALAYKIDGDGSAVFGDSEVTVFNDEPLSVKANGHQLSADYIVIATHVPLTGNSSPVGAAFFQTKLFPYSTYVLEAIVRSDSLAPGLYNDTSDPYWYLRTHDEDGKRHAILGGADHKTGQVSNTDECLQEVEKKLLSLFPSARVQHAWSGQVIETADGLPFIGETQPNQFVATGYSGNGLTFGTVAGMMARDAALHKNNEWSELFDPARKNVRAFATSIKENVDFPYYLLRDRFRSEKGDADTIKAGEGRVLTIGGKRVACSRTQDNKLLAVSAECTHLGCLVHWNHSEETWDCPCHGSRFSATGEVIGGPAETALQPISLNNMKATSTH